MFKHLKNKLIKKNRLLTTVDIHSHILPEIDDGCQDIETSIKIIQGLKKLGYKKLILTPHIMIKRYSNDINRVRYGFYELKSMLKVKNIEMELGIAAEYYCDEHFLSLIRKKELLSFGNNYILFELPYTTRPKVLEKCIRSMLNFKYKPVLAHPERYRFLETILDFKDLKEMGVFFQINLNSLGGYYGKEAQKKGLMLAQKGMVDFVGSDIHHLKHMECFKANLDCNYMEMIFSNNQILNDSI